MASKKTVLVMQAVQAKATADATLDFDASKRVLRKFRLVFNTVKAHFQSIEKKVGIGGAQVWALSVIANNEGIGVNDLALSLDIHQTTASNLVRGLVKLEMIEYKKKGLTVEPFSCTYFPQGSRYLKNPRVLTPVYCLMLSHNWMLKL